MCAERRNIQGHVGGPAGTFLGLADMHHRYRRLRRNPGGGAMPVAVQHDITDDKDTRLLKGWDMYLHGRKQSATDNADDDSIGHPARLADGLLSGSAGVQSFAIHAHQSLLDPLLANMGGYRRAVVPVAAALRLATRDRALDRTNRLSACRTPALNRRRECLPVFPRAVRN